MRKQPKRERPLIGITPDVRTTTAGPSGSQGEPLIFLQERYTRATLDAGGIPVVLSVTPSPTTIRETLEHLDGILLSGGNFDIHPKLYGEETIEALGEVKEKRTQFELELISLALKRDLPLLGVCGGTQAINVALGGSLYQDIASQIPDAIEHQQGTLKEQGGHQIKIHDGTKLKQILGQDTIEVNTTHHQAVKKLGRGLIVNATTEDGIIEGIESKGHSFVLGVQWHPEFLTERDIAQRQIFSFLVAASRREV
ncbi:MAG: gamma-glutamyl-gamma-aminobutyrate hydrolase family protein [Candidatus Binatia bacterium]